METANSADAESKLENKSRTRNPLNAIIAYLANRFGGDNPKEMERFLRFFVVGGLGAVIDLGILLVTQATFLPPTNDLGDPLPTNVAIATALAFSTAVISNFIWTTLWVYPDSQTHSRQKQLIQFTFISVVGGVARTIWVKETFDWIGGILMPVVLPVLHIFDPNYLVGVEDEVRALAEGRLGSIATQMIAMIVVMFWNFFANRYWTYNDVD
jgi:putative flippase GtrA